VLDVRGVTGRKLLWGTGLRKGDLTLLFGCPPCQGFTEHRRDTRKGWDKRNQLLDEYVRLVKETNPRFIAFENVPGLAYGKGKWRFRQALAALRRLGYKVRYGVVDAADFGVPQFRRRVLVIGSRVGDPPFPSATHGDPKSRSVRQGDLLPWATVRDAIKDLPKVASGKKTKGDRLHAARKHTDLNLRRLRAVPRDGGGRESLPDDLVLKCHKKHQGHWDVYGRMWWDRPAPTLTSGCTNITRGRFAHPVQDRAITLREALRLQGFPRGARLGTIGELAPLQVGNAVPPPLAKAAAKAVADAQRKLERETRRARDRRRLPPARAEARNGLVVHLRAARAKDARRKRPLRKAA
jgi:DNA (cytosine-5)-methyltransferase 1